MDYQKSWDELKYILNETIKNFTKLANDYSKKGDFTKARITRIKCREYENCYNRMLMAERN